jgi:hypothetical protein
LADPDTDNRVSPPACPEQEVGPWRQSRGRRGTPHSLFPFPATLVTPMFHRSLGTSINHLNNPSVIDGWVKTRRRVGGTTGTGRSSERPVNFEH